MMKRPLILLAEDSPSVLEYFRQLLEGEGFEVATAVNGLDAMEQLFAVVPDAVVSDVEMPIMNGYHFCRLLKNEPETRSMPFILLTSLTEARYQYWGMEVGADQYVLKEDANEQLLPALRRLLEESRFDSGAIRQLGTKYGSSFNILNRLNVMLDEQLFRITLTNKLTSLVFQDVTLTELARSILGILLNVIHAESVAVAILSAEATHLFIHANRGLGSDYIEAMSSHALDFLETNSPLDLGQGRFNLEYFCELTDEFISFRPGQTVSYFRRLSDEIHMSFHVQPRNGDSLTKSSLEVVAFLLDFVSISLVHTFMQEKIRSLSVIDSLSHLYNRGHFMSLFNSEYRRSLRHNLNLSVIFVDIDNFKLVNDTYGHLSGDLVLKAIADCITRTIRASDVAGRYGGEEFVIYLPETNLPNAHTTAERLRKCIESRQVTLNRTQSCRVTVSLGLASISEIEPGDSVDHILELADKKLYQAKMLGKNRTVM